MAVDQASRLRQLIERNQGVGKGARVVSVASGKGGTGKSVLAVNLAVALRRMGQRVLVLDCDFGLANVDLMLGASARRNLAHVLSGEIMINDAVQEGVEGVRFLSGGSGVEALVHMHEKAAAAMTDSLLQLEQDADIILLDTGAGVNDTVMRLIQASHESVIITTPEPTALMDAYALLKRLNLMGTRLPALRLVINRVENSREAQETLRALPSLAMRFLNLNIEPLGSIAFDPSVPSAIKRQTPLLLAYPGSAAARDIQKIAQLFMGIQATPRTGLSSFFRRFLAKEVAPSSIRVNCVAPGPTQTGWIDEELANAVMPDIPLGKLIQPQDIAETIVFLVSERAAMVTGQVIKVSGGHAV